MPPTHSCRPIAYGWALGLPLAIILALLVIEPTRLDFALADLFYRPGEGFIGAHSFFLEDVMHDRAKQAVIAVALLALAGLVASCLYRPWYGLRRRLGYLVLAMGLSTAIVTPLKALTAVHCPWDLTRYGGVETYTPLLAERAPTAKPGRCWPGGHASSGFTFFALYFLLRDRNRRLARLALVGALALGGLFSVGRMMQGAHFLSHNLWTALLDWLICLGCYRFMLYAPQADEAPQGATELAP
ncbi:MULTISPECIES: phosphatase PAP2 family protein [Pseudomonas]|uniref:phosphatase PAP2 family protein n=1 Tax=Pseudomonas TaxID=286 RepID=UPI000DA71247|nr:MULTISPECIES: phosphatase PAP2 family protein [Pseudomonas]MDW3715603.1 phosphatase PAP2 family protein [Pseudomonas sp. 2023EL-01195]PZE11216.1 phosphoesterase [Pseudomonas sp. 57B-090624]